MKEKKVNLKYSKKQLLISKDFGKKWPILTAILEDEGLYTKEEVLKLVDDFEKRKVDR